MEQVVAYRDKDGNLHEDKKSCLESDKEHDLKMLFESNPIYGSGHGTVEYHHFKDWLDEVSDKIEVKIEFKECKDAK